MADEFLPKRDHLGQLAPRIVELLGHLARVSPSWCDDLRLIDATPVPCGQSRQTVKRSEFAGHAAYGYCAAHSRHFWGFKLYLLAGYTVIGDKGLSVATKPILRTAPEAHAASVDRAAH